MIEFFNFNITEDNRKFINQNIECYNSALISFPKLLTVVEKCFHMGASYYIANKIGTSYEQICDIMFKYFVPSNKVQNRIINIIKEMISNDSIDVTFDVKPSHWSIIEYMAARRTLYNYSQSPIIWNNVVSNSFYGNSVTPASTYFVHFSSTANR